MGRLATIFGLLIAILVGAAFLSAPAPRADFVFLNRGDVSTLDPSQMSWMQDFRVATLLYEGLTRRDVLSAGYDPLPGMAERWEVSPDGLVYTFHLRPATWTNGDPVRATDFVFAWRRCMLPEVGADYAKIFEMIRGAGPFMVWRAKQLDAYARLPAPERTPVAAQSAWNDMLEQFAGTVGLSAPDERTLVVELERPTPYFLDLTGFTALLPINPRVLEQYSDIDPLTAGLRSNPGWTLPPNAATNGPFILESWAFKREMRLRRNPLCWRAGDVALETISIPFIQDGNAQVTAFRTGALDWASDVAAAYVEKLLADRRAFEAEHAEQIAALRAQGLKGDDIDRALPRDVRANIHAFASFGTYFYNFNCRPKLADGRPNPLADSRVRRALAMAVDKDAITLRVRRGSEPAARTFIPPGSLGEYRSPAGLGFDPDAARSLLRDAGYDEAHPLPEVELLFNNEGGHDLIAQAVAADWSRHLGVSVRLVQKESKVFRDDVRAGRFMVSRATWFGDYGDATTFLDLNRTGNGNNDRGYSSPVYDDLLAQAHASTDPSERRPLLERAEVILVDEDLPLLPLFHFVQVYLYDAHRVVGISSHPRQDQAFDRLRIEK